MITWNRGLNHKVNGYMNGYVVKEDMHMWNKMCYLYILYTEDNTWKFKEYMWYTFTRLVQKLFIFSSDEDDGLTGWYGNPFR